VRTTHLAEAGRSSTSSTLTDAPRPDTVAGPALRRLASNLAHNINNALTGVLGYLELALQEAQPGTPLHEHLCVSRNCSLDIAKLVQRIVAFAMPHHAHLTYTQIALDDMAEEAVRQLNAQIPFPQIEISVRGGCSGWVRGNQSLLLEVLTQLIQNAQEALPQGGVVELRTWDDSERCYLSVSDQGEGMPSDVQAHLFEPFFTTKCSGHLGLGLAVCRTLIEAQGGTMHISSTPGAGTIVTLVFPRLEEPGDELAGFD